LTRYSSLNKHVIRGVFEGGGTHGGIYSIMHHVYNAVPFRVVMRHDYS